LVIDFITTEFYELAIDAKTILAAIKATTSVWALQVQKLEQSPMTRVTVPNSTKSIEK
jgi:hypothetical protein